jgi:hypothetical protein
MKKTFVFIASFFSISCFAQDGFFLQPEVGTGTACIHSGPVSRYPGMWEYPGALSNIPAFNAGLSAGYKMHKIGLTAGVEYLTSGYSRDYIGGDLILVRGRETEVYTHIAVPVTVSYKLAIGNRLFVLPGVGVAYSYNISSTITNAFDVGPFHETSRRKNTGSDFTEMYDRSSVWGVAYLKVGYAFNDKLSIIAGPAGQYMLGSIWKGYPADYTQRNYTYTFNVGAIWNLKKEAVSK